ncbi:hypothetical protein FHX35_000797 [Auritidibacter ignavus]|nr:hypothetical protein [Auritidibacter ignavus]
MTNENTRQVHTSVQESAIAIAENWLQSFSEALDSHNAEQVVEVFEPDGFWRDFVAFTWNLYTAEGHEHIRELVAATLEQASPRNWRITEEPVTEDGVTTAWLSFETDAGRGEAIVRIRNNVAWTLLTILEELRGFEERVGRRRPQGVSHRITKGRKTWLETRQEREQTLGVTEQPYTLIVGGRPRRHRVGITLGESSGAHFGRRSLRVSGRCMA